MVTTILHYLFYLLFFCAPLVMNSNTSEIFEFNKMMLIYASSFLIGILWIISFILQKQKIVYKPLFLLLLLVFLITQMISTYFSIDPHTSFFGYYGRWNGGILSITAYSVLFFVFVQLFTKKKAEILLFVSLLSSAIVVIWGLLAKIGYDFSCLVFTGTLTNTCWTEQFQPAQRMFATIGQPNWLGAYLCIHFFIGLYFFMKAFKKEHRDMVPLFGFSAYLILNILSIYFTRSRSALLAFVIALIVGICLVLLRRIKAGSAVFFLFVIGAAIVFINPQRILTQLHAPSPDDLNVTESFDIRKIVWQGAIELGRRYPVFGTGVETFAYSYYFTRPPEHNRTSEWDFIYNKAHNEYLNYFATTGFVGLTGYLSLILGTVVLFYTRYKKNVKKNQEFLVLDLSFYVFLAYVSILVTNFFGFSTSTIQLFFYIIPGLLLVEAGINRPNDTPLIAADAISRMGKGLIVVIFVAGVSGMVYLTRYYTADIKYNTAKNHIASGDYSNALIYLYDALKLKNEHVYEDRLSSTLAYLAFQYSFEDKKQSDEFITLSKYSNYKALSVAQYNMLYWKTQARNYYLYYQISHDMNDMEQAIEAMEQALEIAPTDVQTMYALAVLYVSAGQEAADEKAATHWKDKAQSTLRQIFELKPDYREAQKLGGEV